MEINDFEIMAPVGSFESLHAAINAGANSIYFGVERLNMRSKSSYNFTMEDLVKIVEVCKKNNIKSYLTVNTVLYDSDMPLMREIIDTVKKVGLSAIIAADQAAIFYANSIGVEVHISTQLNVSNIETFAFYSKFSDVIVLARELNMGQVKSIFDEVKNRNILGPNGELVKIEMFVHGALCMAVSGKCYLSLHSQNSSANRGSCKQECRKGYIVTEKESGVELEIDNEYIMSPKDLCTIGFVDKLVESGVRVFKIEGRARSAEYVRATVECYKEAVISVLNGDYTQEKIKMWEAKLETVYNRGFWDGYYLGKRLGEWSKTYGSVATKRKVYVGKVTNYFAKIGVAEILCEAQSVSFGEELIITGENTGVIDLLKEVFYVDDKEAKTIEKGVKFSVKTTQLVRRGDKLYKLESTKI